jgi:uncharacterized protein YggT (Ycf19 family)
MALIDSILNLACALLWLNWRSLSFLSLDKSPPVSLAATLKKAGPPRRGRWIPLFSLAVVLVVRSVFYWNVGAALNWTPNLQLAVVSLPFRSDYLSRTLLFSLLSFALILAGLYGWLLLISIINRKVPNDEPVQRLIRFHLGPVERWPAWLKFLLPLLITSIAWGFGNPALVSLRIVPPPISKSHLWQQAVLLGVASYLMWKLLLLALCVLYLINSYVYLGKSYFWNFVNLTGANLLRPLRPIPLRVGKLDFAPVLVFALVLLLSRSAELWLPRLFQSLPL